MLLSLIILFVVILVGYLCLRVFCIAKRAFFKSEFEKFTYDSAKKETIHYLEENKKELESIADELYKSKSSKERPYKYISYSSYCDYTKYDFSLEKSEYVQFDMDAQGFLGGQYYGLIYSKDKNIYDNKDLFIYDENKETDEGNNIFIRQKISDNWYYYYDDYDGKVQIKNIK